ncbi:MAG: hypothetical protein QF872_06110 [Gammaproteobacteria bacterium]|nr:hypothetical protein [Gammaproteobacteria bacterium]
MAAAAIAGKNTQPSPSSASMLGETSSSGSNSFSSSSISSSTSSSNGGGYHPHPGIQSTYNKPAKLASSGGNPYSPFGSGHPSQMSSEQYNNAYGGAEHPPSCYDQAAVAGILGGLSTPGKPQVKLGTAVTSTGIGMGVCAIYD